MVDVVRRLLVMANGMCCSKLSYPFVSFISVWAVFVFVVAVIRE